MESGTTEVSAPARVVDHVAAQTGQGLLDRLVRIPISEQTATNLLVVSEQFTAPALQKLQSMLQEHAHTIGKAVAIGSAALDITLASICASLSVGTFRGLQKNGELKAARAALFPRATERTSKLFVDKARHKGIALGGGSGTLLVLRPISRIVSWEAHAGAPLAERIGQIMNKMAGGKEAISHPS